MSKSITSTCVAALLLAVVMTPAYAVKSISWSGSTGGDDSPNRMHTKMERPGKGRTWHGTIEDKRRGNGHGKEELSTMQWGLGRSQHLGIEDKRKEGDLGKGHDKGGHRRTEVEGGSGPKHT